MGKNSSSSSKKKAQNGLTPKQQCALLEEHLPYRLELIDMWCAMTALRMARRAGIPLIGVLASMQGSAHLEPAVFYGVTTEAGLIQSRMLLHFVGLNASESGKLSVKGFHETDSRIEWLRRGVGQEKLSLVTADDIDLLGDLHGFGNRTMSVTSLLSMMITDANKAAGHLTTRQKPKPGLRWLQGAICVRVLIERSVYGRLGMPVPAKYPWTTMVLPSLIDSPFAAYLRQVECIFDRQPETFPRQPQPDNTDAKESDQ